MKRLSVFVAGAAALVFMLATTVASADPTGTCPYAYCEYVAPRPPIINTYIPAPWMIPSPTPRPPKQPIIIVINNPPPPAPTATRGPVHFPLYQPYDYECDCYP